MKKTLVILAALASLALAAQAQAAPAAQTALEHAPAARVSGGLLQPLEAGEVPTGDMISLPAYAMFKGCGEPAR